MYLHKTNVLIRKMFPRFVWKQDTTEKVIYLTFDDGPIPEVTQFVLDTLKEYDAKATFFCVGDNVLKNPAIFQTVLEAGHQVGNHTHNHFNAWDTEDELYCQNVAECRLVMENELLKFGKRERVHLFRPPYGKLNYKLVKSLSKEYKLIMWDVLSGDFDPHLSPQKCLEKTITCTERGSIVVFHDSIKTQKCITYVLPQYLDYFSKRGFRFEGITSL